MFLLPTVTEIFSQDLTSVAAVVLIYTFKPKNTFKNKYQGDISSPFNPENEPKKLRSIILLYLAKSVVVCTPGSFKKLGAFKEHRC